LNDILQRSLARDSLYLPARQLLPALDDSVSAHRIEFHQKRPATGLLSRDQHRAAASERVEDLLTRPR
jgi:hypothetical protein